MKTWKVVLVILLVGAAGAWWALRPGPHRMPPPPMPTQLDPKVLAAVGTAYGADVQPLFKRACFDCHSKFTVWPWYHAIPGVRQYLDSDVDDAREDLELSDGFPFNKDVPVLRHLRRIAHQVDAGDMPPWDYRLMHPAARLNAAERATIVQWAQGGFDRLMTTAKDAARPVAAPAPIPASGHKDHD